MVHALRRPHGVRLQRPLRQARARRRAHRSRSRRSGPASAPRRCAATSTAAARSSAATAPLKLPLEKDQAPPQRPLDVAPLPVAALHRVHGGLQHLVRPGLLRAGNRHHAHAPGRACSTSSCSSASSTRPARRSGASTSSTTARRSCTSARSRCARYIKSRFPHIYLYTSTNGLAFTEDSVRRLVHSGIDEVTFSIDGATPESYADVSPARRFRQGDPQPAAAADEKRSAGRDVPFINWRYILFTHNDSDDEMDLARSDGRRHRRRSALLGADRPSRGHVLAPLRAGQRRSSPRSATRSGTTTISATPSPARRRAPRSASAAALPGLPAHRAGPDARCRSPRRSPTARPGRSPRRPAMAAGWCASARSSAGATARSSTATTSAPGCRRPWSRAPPSASPSPSPRPRSPDATAEVRHGQRRHRLVRGVRIADHDEGAGRVLNRGPLCAVRGARLSVSPARPRTRAARRPDGWRRLRG